MRKVLIISFSISSLFIACKATNTASNTSQTTTATTKPVEQNSELPIATGTVSHQFKATGCATVIVIKAAKEEDNMILIPKDKLDAKMDVDGLEITFNYRTLRMPNPPGCNAGIPAELTNITKKK